MKTRERLQAFILNRAVNYISGNPEKNLPKLHALIDRIWGEKFRSMSGILHRILDNPENIWYRYIMNLWKDVNNDILKTIFRNFVINASIFNERRQDEIRAKYGCSPPWAILLDPTSACNLRCTGCWAAEYGSRLNMPYETMDSIIRQGKELGTYLYLFSGGEPLVRKDDIIRLCEAHPDCQFAAFTNGTLIDVKFAEDMLRVLNFVPAISVEGFEEDTDFRRGEGTFAKAESAMAILKERKLPFGISCCYTSRNVEVIGSEEYFDRMIEWGAKFCWFFTYIPIGGNAAPELMVSDSQRAFMYRRIRAFRETKPIYTMDFWNDGEYCNGCIAGGRRYFHINANGDIEPCAFIHYSDTNIAEKTIAEALNSPLFTAFRQGQPFNANLLRPCPLLDNPDALVDIVEGAGAHSTDLQFPEDVRALTAKCRKAAFEWAGTADELWQNSGRCGAACQTAEDKATMVS